MIYLSPQGERLTQRRVRELAALPRLLLLCGRYEGIDQRVIDAGFDTWLVKPAELPELLEAIE